MIGLQGVEALVGMEARWRSVYFMSPARENNPWVQGCRERVAPLRHQTDCRHGSARVASKRAYPNLNFMTTNYVFIQIIIQPSSSLSVCFGDLIDGT